MSGDPAVGQRTGNTQADQGLATVTGEPGDHQPWDRHTHLPYRPLRSHSPTM